MIREKELAFDAQLSATEIVRRCERRIGELVRDGQERGEIAKRGEWIARQDEVRAPHLVRPHEAMGVSVKADAIRESYAMADAPDEQFEAALDEAKTEGNLSRANPHLSQQWKLGCFLDAAGVDRPVGSDDLRR